MKHRCTIFHTRVSPVQIPEKSVSGHVTPNLCFHPVGYVGYVLHFGGSRVGNVDHYFSCLGRPSLDSTKKRVRTLYADLVFLHPVGYAGRVVHSFASGVGNVDTLFFMPEWNEYGFKKYRVGTRYAEIDCLHLVGSAGHVVHSGASGV
jgi:hypothetical protein